MIKIHFQPAIPRFPSRCWMANARRPEKALAREVRLNIMAKRDCMA